MATAIQPTPAQTTTRLLDRFRAVRACSLAFVAPLTPEDLMVQSCAEASPAKWHLAHTTWFFETFLLRDLPDYRPFRPEFHWLFNSYYNSLGDMPAKSLRASFSRPPLDEVLAYRTYVDAAIERLLAGIVTDEQVRRMALGFEHEQQHQELLATDIKHALFTNPLHPAYQDSVVASLGEEGGTAGTDAIPARVAGGVSFTTLTPANHLVEIGLNPDPAEPESFAFDNETPRHTVYLRPFRLANRLVTCAEYLDFMNDNAYTRPELWLSEGWSAMRADGWQAPLYWQRDSSSATGWKIYTMRGFKTLPERGGFAETPVCHLSFFEADAYARWADARLPTEFEWEYAATTLDDTAPGVVNPAAFALPRDAHMLERGGLHPARVADAPGLRQMFGDVWEWTSSGYTGYPGYKPLPGALGEYNGKFMSSQVILRGGSCVTPATHIRPTYRNFFPPATRWQFAGLRLAKDA